MKRYFRIGRTLFLTGILTLNLLGYSGSHTAKGDHNQIKNFGRINANYYRGGQPKAKDIATLKELGIKTVISLRNNGPREEEVWVRAAGMKYFNLPLSTTRPATREQTQKFLKLVSTPAHWPVLVHCAGGTHRTGAMTAIYRITFDSWTADMAYREMKQYGFYSFPNHGALKRFVYQYRQNTCGASKSAKSSSPAFEVWRAYASAKVD
jgi:tyrosine-protein phosphatase SIW14